MDLTVTHANGNFTTKLYEKPQNPCLYLPSFSCHTPGVLKSLVFGMTYRIYRLTSLHQDQQNSIHKLFLRLLSRGYTSATLKPLFELARRRHLFGTTKKKRIRENYTEFGCYEQEDLSTPIFLHLKYHPLDPSRSYLQFFFRQLLLSPYGKEELPYLPQRDPRYQIGISSMNVAYHRHRNLRDILSPRKLKDGTKPASTVLASILESRMES
jgi:hypothetical protein